MGINAHLLIKKQKTKLIKEHKTSRPQIAGEGAYSMAKIWFGHMITRDGWASVAALKSQSSYLILPGCSAAINNAAHLHAHPKVCFKM
jgi:hypothetical protein